MDTALESPGTSRPWQRGFWALIITQFQGAFSDNALKYLVLFLILSGLAAENQHETFVTRVGLLFSVPFILFSMVGGYLADRFSKRNVTIATKAMEIAVMSLALAGLAFGIRDLQLAAIFLISTQAALFGPSKYGLLPELLPEPRLSWGNGVIELGTFLAIIAGTAIGPLMAEQFRAAPAAAGVILVAVSCVGLMTSFGISRVPAANPARKFEANFVADLWRQYKIVSPDRVLFHAIVGSTYFWFIAALLQQNLLVYGKDVLHLSDTNVGLLNAAVAVGIGLGSLAAGYISGNKIEAGLIPLGSLGMSFWGLMLYLPDLSFRQVALLLAMLGFAAGFFIVPILAMIQHRPDADKKGGVIAATNLLSFIGVALAAAVYHFMTAPIGVAGVTLKTFHLSPSTIFLYSALFSLFATAYIIGLLPEALARLVLILATHTVYKIRVVGRENVPPKGGALLVCNHLSFMDALLLGSALDRNVRFILFKDIYDKWYIKPIAKMMHAIPISSNLRPRDMIRSLRDASDSIKSGRVVCIFAEGQITRIGRLLPFRRGMERIMKGVDAPIIPVHLDGVWGSMFSFERGRFFWKIPYRVPFPVTVSFGRPMSPAATAMEVRAEVQRLETAAFAYQKARMETLHRGFVRTARKHPRRFAMADGKTPKVRFGTALIKTIFLANRLKKLWKGQKMVGLLIPPSVGGSLVNYAALLCGKVPVNLNYTASNEIIESCARQCDIKTTVTARAFLERLPNLKPPGEAIYLEDLAAEAGALEKLTALLLAWFAPFEFLEKYLGSEKLAHIDDLATVIFSSGSTGDPKGVMLSHYNVASNIDQVARTFALDKHDRILGILPFFHSFGFTITLWLPATMGMGVVFHPNPLDAVTIGALVRTYSVTFLVATPTFLQAYIRRVPAEDFGSLQFVIVGAEKLTERIAQAFEDTFGLKPLEGYGCTECAPVVAVNSRDFRAPGFRQVGYKRGRIGHPLPGISARILDVETGAELPIGREGLLQISGPNVMMGYLGKPEKTAESLQNGWYNTGDIAVMDEDGFLTITDRLSRFSKIAGEMVPHIKVEEKLHELLDAPDQVFAVTGVPDGKKGERLMVLHTLAEDKLKEVLEKFAKVELPPLWKPRPAQFIKVDALPYLGSGKLDLRKIKEMSMSAGGAPAETES